MVTPHISRITPLGATRTVTGSKYLIEHENARVLVDCGLFQGGRKLRERNWERFEIDPASVDAVIITHAHLDHCGYLPRLAKDGFNGPVFATHDTAKLMSVVLPDSGRLQQEEAKHANKYGYSRHQPALALYDEDEAWKSLELIKTVPFDQDFHPASGITATFLPAGHILGSAILRVSLKDGKCITFSGDLGRPSHPLLIPPRPVGECDYLFVESTYGNREHVDANNAELFADLVTRTVARGGITVVPSFAVDRTEVLLYHMCKMIKSGAMPNIPVFVDSPMALDALTVYRTAFEESAEDVRPELYGIGDPFMLPNLTEVRDVEGSKALVDLREPAIIIAGAGMATGGRVIHHLKRLLPDPINSVAMVGFQVPGSRGRLLLDGAKTVKIHGQDITVSAEICDLTGFSVHADASELLDWVGTTTSNPRVFVIHGEEDASFALAAKIDARFGFRTTVPEYKERLAL